jgi:pyridoxamine 5'-phosphate oxidase
MNQRSLRLPDLDDGVLGPDPVRQFHQWHRLAVDQGLKLPDAMALATASADGTPSVRMVLLKGFDERGLLFYTNYHSRKGRELDDNPKASVVIHWAELDRSVRAEGIVGKIPREESERYFATRPRESQLSSWASAQSSVISGRAELDARYEEFEKRYEGTTIPCPESWGGYRIVPLVIEFWQQRFARLNDRIMYTKKKSGAWEMKRLAP